MVSLACHSVAAQTIGGIAAVVNEEAITVSDLEGRIALGLLAAGLPNTEQARQGLRPQVLRTLIDERLRLQEATRLGIEAASDAVADGVASIAQQNGLGVDAMTTMFQQRGIPISTLEDQVRATLSWNELVTRRLSGDVQISETDIDEVIARFEATRGLSEYLLAEIVLPVADRQSEANVASFAREIVQQIRNGASFAAIARQFSAAAGADSGGDLGWVLQGGFPTEIEQALASLEPGRLTEPLRTTSGYSIYLMRDKRRVLTADPSAATITLRRLAVPIPPSLPAGDRQALIDQLEGIRQTANNCQSLREASEQQGLGSIEDLGTGKVSDLGDPVRGLVANLPADTPSALQEFPNGAVFYMVCDRSEPGGSLPERSEIARDLSNEQIDRLQRRYLRDLRNAAYIEVRI
ncbi:MAG: peptidylprolyl isomerase [Pseudomonadota bacterium]